MAMILIEITLLLIACAVCFSAGGNRGYKDGIVKVLNTIEFGLNDKNLSDRIATKLMNDMGQYKNETI